MYQNKAYQLQPNQRHFQYNVVTTDSALILNNPFPFIPEAISRDGITTGRQKRDPVTKHATAEQTSQWWQQPLEKSGLDDPAVLQRINAAQTVYIIADGSHNYDTDTFGWLLGSDTEIIAEGYGHCPISLSTSSF